MNEFSPQFTDENRLVRRSLQAAGSFAVAAGFLMAPGLAHADDTVNKSDTATATIEMSAEPTPSPQNPGDIGINDDAMYPSPEPTSSVYPDIGINDDALYPVQPNVTETLPKTGLPMVPALITGLGLVGAGASLLVASKRQ